MTDVASDVPAPRPDSGAAVPAGAVPGAAVPGAVPAGAVPDAAVPAAPPAVPESDADGQTVLDRGREAAERVGEQVSAAVTAAGDAVERAAAASSRVASQVVDRLRNNAELAAERGRTTIANEVVEKIAGIAAREVPGVYDLGGDVARMFAAVKDRVGLGDADADSDRGVSVRLEGGTAVIDVTIVIEFGFQVYSVTEAARVKVINSVENLLGLEVVEVNITVDDVHIDDSGPVGNDEARAAGYQA
jgi:uncharacterized alkaline shock family protein YloU